MAITKDKNEVVTIDNTEALVKVAEMGAEKTEAPTELITPVEETEIPPIEETAPIVMVEGTTIAAQTETIIVFHVTRPLMSHEYDELEKRVRLENEKSGLKIVLAPFSVEVEVLEGVV